MKESHRVAIGFRASVQQGTAAHSTVGRIKIRSVVYMTSPPPAGLSFSYS